MNCPPIRTVDASDTYFGKTFVDRSITTAGRNWVYAFQQPTGPAEVWVAIPRGEWRPKSDGLRLRIVQFSGKAVTIGIETQQVEGVKIAVTDVARTIVDCFKFRHKIGTDVAVEALRDGWGKKRFTMKELWRYARVYRMS